MISIQSPDPLHVIQSVFSSSETVFHEALAHIDGLPEDYLWFRAAKWNSDTKTVELVGDQHRYPSEEEFFVTAPALIESKSRYSPEWFERKWDALSEMSIRSLTIWTGNLR